MAENDPDSKQKEVRQEGVPLKEAGEYQVPLVDTLAPPPADKKIHERRPLPLVPTKKP